MKITRIGVSDGNDSIVVIRDLSDLSGGRTLDMSGWTGKDVHAGHIIIKKANGDYAPLGVDSMAYVDLSTGEEYAGVLKKSVTKKDPRAAIMTRGIVNYKALPYEIDDTIAAGLNDILFAGYVPGEEPGPTPPTPTADYLYFEAVQANSTVGMMSTLETAPDLEYSTDGATWQEWQHTTADDAHTFDTLTLTAVGDRVYLRGDNPAGMGWLDGEEGAFSQFIMSGQINSGGSVTSLIDGDGVSTTILTPGSLMLLFGDITEGEFPNTALLTAPSLGNVTVIGDSSCFGMFEYCINLESPSYLSKVITIGYNGCFSFYAGCENLTSVSDFTALTTVAEGGLFNFCIDCEALISPANMPSLTTIGKYGCENLYYVCTSLESAANMPSLTDIGYFGFYNMYGDCTFDMSSDGTTLNFDFPTPPITTPGLTPEEQETYATAYDVAQFMGNTNGFTEP